MGLESRMRWVIRFAEE